MIDEIVYLGRNNYVHLSLSVTDPAIIPLTPVIIDHTTLTRCQILVGTLLIDSAVFPSYFDFTNDNKLILKLGESQLTAGRYVSTLIIFNNENPLGIVWGNLIIVVKGFIT